MEHARATIDPGSELSLRRLQTLTDCIFAFCLILLVVFLDKPPPAMEPTEANIQAYLFGQFDLTLAYVVTFINIAFFWFFTHNMAKYLRRSNGAHVWLTLVSLMFVGLLPFANGLNAAFSRSFTIHLFYSGVVFLVGAAFAADWIYATRKDRLVDRSIQAGAVEELIVESLIQPIAALLSIAGAFIGTFWWELPFMLVPVAVPVVSKIWERRRVK